MRRSKLREGVPAFIRDALKHASGRLPKGGPDFFLIGATRSGSTYLYHMLRQHPGVFLPGTKELHYFNHDGRYREDLRNYRTRFFGYKGQPRMGEATPMYLEPGLLYDKDGRLEFFRDESAVARIARHFPNTKLIVSLRDPLTRMASMHKKSLWQRKACNDLEKEVQEELRCRSRFHLLHRNRYDLHLDHIFRYFDHSAVKVLLFEEWTREPQKTVTEICEFLDLEALRLREETEDVTARNPASRFKKRSEDRDIESMVTISESVRWRIAESLRAVKPYVEEVIGRKPPWSI